MGSAAAPVGVAGLAPTISFLRLSTVVRPNTSCKPCRGGERARGLRT